MYHEVLARRGGAGAVRWGRARAGARGLRRPLPGPFRAGAREISGVETMQYRIHLSIHIPSSYAIILQMNYINMSARRPAPRPSFDALIGSPSRHVYLPHREQHAHASRVRR